MMIIISHEIVQMNLKGIKKLHMVFRDNLSNIVRFDQNNRHWPKSDHNLKLNSVGYVRRMYI